VWSGILAFGITGLYFFLRMNLAMRLLWHLTGMCIWWMNSCFQNYAIVI
jgi:hypothetical protein